LPTIAAATGMAGSCPAILAAACRGSFKCVHGQGEGTMTVRMLQGWWLRAVVVGVGLVAGPALADTDKMGPVSLATANCGVKISANLLIYTCANPAHCDYAVGVSNYSGTPVSYKITIDAPAGYKVFEQGQRTSKNYDSFRVVQAPQSLNGPSVKVGLNCAPQNTPTTR
jgi:hypothetical protein